MAINESEIGIIQGPTSLTIGELSSLFERIFGVDITIIQIVDNDDWKNVIGYSAEISEPRKDLTDAQKAALLWNTHYSAKRFKDLHTIVLTYMNYYQHVLLYPDSSSSEDYESANVVGKFKDTLVDFF